MGFLLALRPSLSPPPPLSLPPGVPGAAPHGLSPPLSAHRGFAQGANLTFPRFLGHPPPSPPTLARQRPQRVLDRAAQRSLEKVLEGLEPMLKARKAEHGQRADAEAGATDAALSNALQSEWACPRGEPLPFRTPPPRVSLPAQGARRWTVLWLTWVSARARACR